MRSKVLSILFSSLLIFGFAGCSDRSSEDTADTQVVSVETPTLVEETPAVSTPKPAPSQDSSTATTTDDTATTPELASIEGVAQLGYLASAKVNIYKMETNGSRTLLWSETTSNGTSLDEIGRFDTHSSELQKGNWYLYEVKGGEDWDADDDGVMDTNATQNRGVLRALVKADDLESLEQLRVNLATELLYEAAVPVLAARGMDETNLTQTMNDTAALILAQDLDGDGSVSAKDALRFDPVEHKEMLNETIKEVYGDFVGMVHEGKIPALNFDQLDVGPLSEKIDFIINFISDLYIREGSPTIVLSSDGSTAYVVDTGKGLVIIDISDPANPATISTISTGSSGYWSVALSPDGSTAYLGTNAGLAIIDVTEPANPAIISTVGVGGRSVTVSPDGSIVYVNNYSSGGLSLIDVSDPENPQIISSVDTSGYVWSVTLSPAGRTAYVVSLFSSNQRLYYVLDIIDVSDPANPRVLTTIDTPGRPLDVAVSPDGSTAYVADGGAGLTIIDVSDPANPRVLTSIGTPGWALGVALSSDGSTAYVGADRGLAIIDVSKPADPVMAGPIKMGYASCPTLSPDELKAYVGIYEFGLMVVALPL